MISWALKNCLCQRFAHLRRTNPKPKYSLTRIRYCIGQSVREGGNEAINAKQTAVTFCATDDFIARRRALRLPRMVLMKKENIPNRTVKTYRFIDVDVANTAKTMEHDLLRVSGTQV